jgi:trimeric autotransporter adhesin
MASTYVNDLRLEEIADGEQSGTWGATTNTNLELIGEALGYGTEAITTNADTHTSTVADGAADPARAMFIKYTGTLDSTCTITIAPNTLNRLHFIHNATSGSQSIIIKQGSGATITIPTGDTKAVYLDGAGSGAAVTDAFASLSVVDLKVQDDLTVNDDILLNSDSAVISFGADADTTLTHTDGSGLTLNGTNKLMFNDASQFIQGASATVLDIAATDEIELTATLIDVVGNQTISGTLGVTGIATFTDDIIIGDGKTIGSASDVDAMTIASNGQVTFTQTLIGTALDISGDIDVDGTTNLDVVDVDGAVNFAADVTFADGADIITASAGTSNFRAGVNAGNSIESGGNYNVLVGDEAGTAISTGDNNTLIGYAAGDALTTGSHNTFVGENAGTATTGSNNTGIGRHALTANTSGVNTAVGYTALDANTTGTSNVAVGDSALGGNVAGDQSVAIGTEALLVQNPSGNADMNNVAVGYRSGYAVTTGTGNTLIGGLAGDAITTASNLTAVGTSALGANTTGTSNTAVGGSALSANTTASNNTAVGYQSLLNTTANRNTGLGNGAGSNITTGLSNTALGSSAIGGSSDVTGNNNIGIGAWVDGVVEGPLAALTSGYENISIGNGTLRSLTSGFHNLAIGYRSLKSSTTGDDNIALGKDSLGASSTGTKNLAIGTNAGSNLSTGSGNLYIGYGTQASAGGVNSELVFGNSLTGKGDTTCFIQGQVYNSSNTSTWNTTSDRRIKKNIVDNNTGLNAINQVQVRNFEYRTEDEIVDFDNPKSAVVKKQGVQLGVIAQEIQSILPDMVKEESTGVLSVNPDNMTWHLVNAVKELSAQVTALTARITELEG